MKPLAVYVHIPFCFVKCGYCDFNTYAGLDALKGDYARALVREVESYRDLLAAREVTSISFGGGTPGEFPVEGLAVVIEAIRDTRTVAADAEISLEGNPGTTPLDQLVALRAAGVNRISFGAQSFDVAQLQFLDRIHSPEAIGASVDNARRAGIESVGLDLMYGVPGQSLASFQTSLERAIMLTPEHLSCYALTVEEGTPLASRIAAGEVECPDPDLQADMYELAEERLPRSGFGHYEISNWARPGHQSRHNLVYWTDGEYLGIGAGAHGYVEGERYENIAQPRQYNRALLGRYGLAEKPAVAHAYRPDSATAMGDWLETALRLVAGFDPLRFATRFGCRLEDALGPVMASAVADGLVVTEPARVRLTARGRLLHSEVVTRAIAHLSLSPV